MPRRKIIPEGTPITYAQFRTGLSFADVVAMLKTADEDPTRWKYKRRGTVLGTMRAMKLQMWADFAARNPHLVACEPAGPATEEAPF